MRYLKSLLFYFLVVFFVNYLFPGVEIINQTKIPHIGGDIIFAAGLGFLNSLILPCLKMFDGGVGLIRVSIVILVLNFAAYAFLKLLPLGVMVVSVEGYFINASIVSIGSILLSYGQMRQCQNCKTHTHDDETHHHM
jgi:hypothetical protein